MTKFVLVLTLDGGYMIICYIILAFFFCIFLKLLKPFSRGGERGGRERLEQEGGMGLVGGWVWGVGGGGRIERSICWDTTFLQD